MNDLQPTPIKGLRYWLPPPGALLSGLDGKVQISYDGLPLPLLEADYVALADQPPGYDAVGRGVYEALRSNPECNFATRYARLLSEGYPHYLAELASHIVMLDRKDVEVSYLDRKVNYLKIIALLEPDNAQLPLQIGMTLIDKGLRLSALHLSTTALYQAEGYLRKSLQLAPDDIVCQQQLSEVTYMLGRYQESAGFLSGILPSLAAEQAEVAAQRLQRISSGQLPFVPVVDYLMAIAVAFEHFQQKEWAEAAAILEDVLDDALFCAEYPLAEIYYILGVCYVELQMPRYGEDYLRRALTINADYPEAEQALAELVSG